MHLKSKDLYKLNTRAVVLQLHYTEEKEELKFIDKLCECLKQNS